MRTYLFLVLIICLALRPAAFSQQQPDSLSQQTRRLQLQLQAAGHDSTRLRLLKELVDLNMDAQPAPVGGWIREGVTTAGKNHALVLQTGFLLQELRYLNQQGQFALTLKKAGEMAGLLEKSGKPEQQVACFMSMGHAHQRLGNYDMAASNYSNAVTLSRKYSLHGLEVMASMNMAILYQYQNRNEDMQQLLLQTLALARQYGLKENIPMIQFNLSNAEARLNNFGKSISYLQELLPYYEARNNRYALGLAYANLSWCYFKSQQNTLALDYSRKSYSIRTALKDAAGLAHLDLNLSKIHLGMGQYDSSNHYALAALQKSLSLHLVNDIRDNYETLATLHERQGHYAKAVEYLHAFASWKDSVTNLEKAGLLEQELRKSRYDSIAQLHTLLQQTEGQKNSYKKTAWILGACLTLLLFAIVLVKRNLASRKDRLTGRNNKAPGQETNPDNEPLLQQITALQQLKDDLQKKLDRQESADIGALRDMVESGKLHSESYWNEFLLLFSKVYPQFFTTMSSTYPDLTRHELRICALIKLNHDVQDIARVMNITADSVRKARYRLYKKMGLDNDKELFTLIIRC